MRHAGCVHRLRYTHSPSQPAVSLQPQPCAKNGRLRPCADPARLACGAVGRLCGAADRAPAAPDVVTVNAMRRDGFGREALPPGALAVDHGFPASVAATPVLAVAGGSAVLGREARRHIWLFTTRTNGPQLGRICRASAFRRREREPVPMARTPIESRANDVGTGGTGTANSPYPAGHADEVRGRARRHTSSCLPDFWLNHHLALVAVLRGPR